MAGKLRLVERIGCGARGAVYRAEQTPLGREVAVKIINPTRTHMAVSFFEAAYEASRVHHPNVASICDFGEEDGLLFLVTEYVPGMTLDELVDSRSPLPVERALGLMLQVVMALEAVHRAGIVHADVESGNLMVTSRPQGELVKLLDLGVARRLAPVGPRSLAAGCGHAWCSASEVPPPARLARAARPSRPGSCASGTPGYTAPEVIRGAAPGYASDVYAAGVVLYQLVTGTRPFPGRTCAEVVERQLAGDPRPPSMLRAYVPRALESIVMRASARAPEERYADASELRRALETVAVALLPGMFPCGPRRPPAGPRIPSQGS